jgi:hypothetical protein
LIFTPAAVPVTFTVNVQEVFTGLVPPDRLTTEDPATAVAVPPHVLLRAFGVATTRPAGRLSVKARPVNEMVLATGFVRVNVKEVEALSAMLAAPKALAIVGGEATERLAVAVLPVPPFVEETLPVVLMKLPAVEPVTLTPTVHEDAVAIVPPVRLIEPDPAIAVAVPPQVLVRPLGVATTRPAGKLSVKATPA